MCQYYMNCNTEQYCANTICNTEQDCDTVTWIVIQNNIVTILHELQYKNNIVPILHELQYRTISCQYYMNCNTDQYCDNITWIVIQNNIVPILHEF